MLEKLKLLLSEDAVYTSLLIIFVAVASFGLGRVSITDGEKQVANPSGVTFIQPQIKENKPETPQIGTEIQLVASKSGTRYHLLTCPGASQIKDENKVFFSSVEKAKAAGYTPAANCEF